MTLEDVLADERENARILAYNGHHHDAELLRRVCDRVAKAAVEYLEWVSEADAKLRSGRSTEFFRSRFGEWERAGHAAKRGRVRWYRLLVVPRRANTSAAFEAGRKGAA